MTDDAQSDSAAQTAVDRVLVRLANEYTVDWPLWSSTIPGATKPEDWHLSADLTARLRAWAVGFNDNYDDIEGWRNPSLWQPHREQGFALASDVQRELGPSVSVRLELWEVGGLPPHEAVPLSWEPDAPR